MFLRLPSLLLLCFVTLSHFTQAQELLPPAKKVVSEATISAPRVRQLYGNTWDVMKRISELHKRAAVIAEILKTDRTRLIFNEQDQLLELEAGFVFDLQRLNVSFSYLKSGTESLTTIKDERERNAHRKWHQHFSEAIADLEQEKRTLFEQEQVARFAKLLDAAGGVPSRVLIVQQHKELVGLAERIEVIAEAVIVLEELRESGFADQQAEEKRKIAQGEAEKQVQKGQAEISKEFRTQVINTLAKLEELGTREQSKLHNEYLDLLDSFFQE